MMGVSHAVTGAAAWLLVAGSVPTTLGVIPAVDGPALAVGMVVTAGAALLPDIDHRNGSMAHALPPVSTMMARTTERVAGGHRKGTHSLLGLVVAVAWSAVAGLITVDAADGSSLSLGAGLCAVLLAACALQALDLTKSKLFSWLWALAMAALVAVFGADNWVWLPAAVGVGYAVHLLGDLVTTGGISVFWPLVIKSPKWWRKVPLLARVWKPSGAISVPILGNAGSARERLVLCLLVAWSVWVCAYEWAGVNVLSWIAPATTV